MITADGWTMNMTSKGFLGMTAHWVEVANSVWMLRSTVIRFRNTSGGHGGDNMGWYMVGLMDHAGIMGKDFSKVKFHTHGSTENQLTDKIITQALLHDP